MDVHLVGDGVGRGVAAAVRCCSRQAAAPSPSAPWRALGCLALLPLVWGRERVSRAVRVQPRARWETYVAAVQHREALLVGDLKTLCTPVGPMAL